MIIAILKERRPQELRVAATPEIVKKMVQSGAHVQVETGAGIGASFSDTAYAEGGATITNSLQETLKNADVVLKVQAPTQPWEDKIAGVHPEDQNELQEMKPGCMLMGMFSPLNNPKQVEGYLQKKLTVLSLDLAPRVTRAQAIDVLSSQTNLAGYRAVIEASALFNRVFPMMMTAAGTVPPTKVLILGAGVAGLQAIATARRLGAVVSAFDVRPEVKEQVQSLGARFIEVEVPPVSGQSGGSGIVYAQEMSADYQKRQNTKIQEALAVHDIVITTALIPGKPAPVLISEEMVKGMKRGSVIVDMAVEMGGNCILSEKNKIVEKHGVKILGEANLPSRVAQDASLLFARNLYHMLQMIRDEKSQKISLDFEDEVVQQVVLTYAGKVISPFFSKYWTDYEKNNT